MRFYQIQIEIMENKADEFIRSLRTNWFEFLREEGCLNYHVYQQFENKNSFCLIGEFNNYGSMENHFKTKSFGFLIGAAGVLSKSVKMKHSEVMKSGGLEMAKSLRMVEK
jgi:quinol monooxygenase YgiN